jgi:DNA-binding response OmpR family regulator
MKRKSILLVDDERFILHSLSRELALFDFEVTTATSGEEGIARIDDGAFDLVITDLSMPGLDGFQVLKAAKRRNAHTMVIILTGYADRQASIDALRLDADDFLEKPCDTDEIIYRISNCLTKQALRKKTVLHENILPVCCYCKRLRHDDQDDLGKEQWYSMEEYFMQTQGVIISHGCCPDCYIEQAKKRSSC